LKIDEDEAWKIYQYLSSEYLAQSRVMGGFISITFDGIKEAERLLLPQQQSDEKHFPAMNFISVNEMNNSQIMQGSVSSSQKFSFTQQQNESIKEFINLFDKKLSEIQFQSVEDKQEAIAEVSTIKAQLDSPKPKWEIIKSAGNTLKGVLEKAAAIELVEYLKDLF
jgi:hypothetical protein